MTKKQETITYLGPEGSYTEIAAEKAIQKMGIQNYISDVKSSIIKVIESVDKNNGSIGIVPIENSIEGIVRETVDNLIKTTSRVVITKEIIVPISHCLISKSTDIKKIDKILSISQALAQCKHFINKTFDKDIELIQSTSTSEAVRQLKDLPDNYAAIGSTRAAEIFGLNILAREINDEKDNLTRFVCLGSEMTKATGNDKTSVAFCVSNTPGALFEVLKEFKNSNINLSYIESRPSKKVFGDYTFFIDFDGHISDEKVQLTLGKIIQYISFYRILGSYSKATV